jgi:PleD family two-component response regulator
MTASFGVARYVPGESLWDAVKNADLALYLAKRSGKNTIRIQDQTTRDVALVG